MVDTFPRYADVTATRVEHDRVVVDVRYDQPGATDRNIPYQLPFAGGAITPRTGERVIVDELPNGALVAGTPLTSAAAPLPEMGEHELNFQWSDGTKLSVRKEAGSYNITIEAEGTVKVNAPTVELGPDASVKQAVSRKGDKVSVSDPLSGTLAGQIDEGSTDVSSS